MSVTVTVEKVGAAFALIKCHHRPEAEYEFTGEFLGLSHELKFAGKNLRELRETGCSIYGIYQVMLQLTDLVYDGVFEVLQWLLFLSAVPPVQLLTGLCVTAKALPDISAISALTAVKHGNCSSLTPLLNPVRTRKSLIWP